MAQRPTSRQGKTVRRREGIPEPRLPHERDESADSQAGQPHPVIEQAVRDIESGQVDTDRGPVLDAVYQRQRKPR